MDDCGSQESTDPSDPLDVLGVPSTCSPSSLSLQLLFYRVKCIMKSTQSKHVSRSEKKMFCFTWATAITLSLQIMQAALNQRALLVQCS